MSHVPADLDTYFQRIGYSGNPAVDGATLTQLIELHTHAIAFENLSSLAGEHVSLELPSIQDKLLLKNRGGYCFEHNTLLWHVLQQLGFAVTGLAARVRWNIPNEVTMPIGHMVLKVVVDDEAYLIDAGFGGLTLTRPLRLHIQTEQATTHEPFRIVLDGSVHTLTAKLGTEWKPLFNFELHEYQPADYAVWNWFTCTAPQSPFVNNLMTARPVKGGRHALANNRYTYRSIAGEVTTRYINTASELRAVLENEFDIRVPTTPALQAKLEEIAARSAQ